MEPWLDDSVDDLQSLSFNSTTTTTSTDIHRSTSSDSDRTSSSTHFHPSPALSASKLHSPTTTTSDDPCWVSVRRFPSLSLSDIRFLHRFGADDIGFVYLAKLKPPLPAAASTDPPRPPPPAAASTEPLKSSPLTPFIQFFPLM